MITNPDTSQIAIIQKLYGAMGDVMSRPGPPVTIGGPSTCMRGWRVFVTRSPATFTSGRPSSPSPAALW